MEKMPTVCAKCENEFKSKKTSGKCDVCGYVMEDVKIKKDAINLYSHILLLSSDNDVAKMMLRHMTNTYCRINFYEECVKAYDTDSGDEEHEMKTNRR